MSPYVVLARRWRPRSFDSLVGQDHVAKALINALKTDRISHAFLFSGIRGTGKTTLARLLALCLNCQNGVSSEPCGTCGSCREIIAGNHPDVMEVDAASRTKVEQMRELLDLVGYAPTSARYKIFILDEVHMLSTPSFNALLKTLEEPPHHVKFLFATTELRKIPATILSRCQRYELKRVSEDVLVKHMGWILEQEGIPSEKSALSMVAQAAEGSVRDALSLLDQVISHGAGTVNQATVKVLLGLADREAALGLLRHLLTGNGPDLLNALNSLYQGGVEPENLIRDILELVHLGVRFKVAGGRVKEGPEEDALILSLEKEMVSTSTEHLQMIYMVLNKGGQELRLTDQPWRAMEMLLLRACHLAPVPDLQKLIRILKQGSGNSGSSLPQTGSDSRGDVTPHEVQGQSNTKSASYVGIPGSWDACIALVRERVPSLAMKLKTQLACLSYNVALGDEKPSLRVELSLINDCFGPPEGVRGAIEDFFRGHIHGEVDIKVFPSSVDRPETQGERVLREETERLSLLEQEVKKHPFMQAMCSRFKAEIVRVEPLEQRVIH